MLKWLGRQFKRKFFVILMVGMVVFGALGTGEGIFARGIFISAEDRNGNTNWEVFKNSILHPFSGDVPLAGDDGYGAGEGDDEDAIAFGVLLLQQASNFLQWTVSDKLYNDVFFSEEAREGLSVAWTTVRDFINMFYLLILVFLAITTILQVNKFSDKKLFLKVIISAILVNFSMAITVAVIDASNLLMDFFAKAINDAVGAHPYGGTRGLGAFFMEQSHYADTFKGGLVLRAGVSIMEFIVQVVMAVMLFFLAISLLIRLVAYWVLIVLSPLAFFTIAIPGSDSFNEWKSKLLNYSFYGPLMLLFMWIAVVLMRALNNSFLKNGTESILVFFTSYITVLYLLYYGHDKAKSMANKAGDFVGKIMDKGGQYAVKAGKGAAVLNPVGAAGYLGYKYGKSKVKSEYTGMKTAMKDGRFGKVGELMTKEGRKKAQEEQDFNAKIRYAEGSKRDKLQMEEIGKTQKEFKDKNINLDNKDFVLDLLNNKESTAKEKRMAAYVASQKGWLKGDDYASAMEAAQGNKLLTDSINANAGDKNKFAMLKYNISGHKKDTEKEKYIKEKLKKVMPENEIDNFINTKSDEDIKRKAVAGIMKGMNLKGVTNFINEEDDIAQYAKEYFGPGGLGEKQFSEDGMMAMHDDLKNEKTRNMLRPILLKNDGRTRGSANTNTNNNEPIIEVVSGGVGSNNSRSRTVFGPDGRPV